MYCILGQGLAGTILAFRLKSAGVPFKIVDNGFKNSSSIVAAGLWNPIVFKRINKSYMADEFLGEMDTFYPEMEELLKANFYHPIKIARVHASKWEHDTWFEKLDLPLYRRFLTKEVPELDSSAFVEMPFGANIVDRCGHLDTHVFLHASRDYFQRSQNLIEAEFILPETVEELEEGTFSSFKFERIIDCRGYQSAQSPWWQYLPFGLTKGETLTVKCPGLKLNDVFNSGFFLLPLGEEIFKIGATFNWDQPNPEKTEAGKNELIEKFQTAVKLPFEIIDHQAGVRPTVRDRRPLFGKHPLTDKLYIFNGLGAKGVMMAPYFSALFLDFMTKGVPLPKDIDINRFTHLLTQN